MSLESDGFWKGGFWSPTFWQLGFWFETNPGGGTPPGGGGGPVTPPGVVEGSVHRFITRDGKRITGYEEG